MNNKYNCSESFWLLSTEKVPAFLHLCIKIDFGLIKKTVGGKIIGDNTIVSFLNDPKPVNYSVLNGFKGKIEFQITDLKPVFKYELPTCDVAKNSEYRCVEFRAVKRT